MTVLGELARGAADLLDTRTLTVTGQTLGEAIARYDIRARGEAVQTVGLSPRRAAALADSGWADRIRGAALRRQGAAAGQHAGPVVLQTIQANTFDPFDCVRTVANAYSTQGGLYILYGNIAPAGSVVKTAGVDPRMLKHSGPAVLFESQDDACRGILGGRVQAGDVVVIRNEGPRGGPGMQEMLAPTSYIKGAGLGERCALITDGRFSGGTAGACIGHVSPEAAAGGPIGLLRDGDIIEIDIPGRTLNVRLSEAELAERRAARQERPRELTGWLARYAAMVTSADEGAVLRIR